jgi:hypothetical protein
MDSSQITPPTSESPSSPTLLPPPEPAADPSTAVPPLRVKAPSSIPSTTTPSPQFATSSAPDPVSSGPTPSSPEAPGPVKLNVTALTELARGAVLTFSLYVHSALARTDAEKAMSVWIADEEDQAQIGDPIATVAQRRGAAAGLVSKDTAALIEAGIGLLAYGVKNVKKVLAARRAVKQAAAMSPAVNHETGAPA